MIRQPPTSTLFPYTTLFRSPPASPPPTIAELTAAGESEIVEFKSSVFHSYKPDIPEKVITGGIIKTVAAFLNTNGGTLAIGMARSEEHTSELQSQSNLVCRL